MHDRKNMSRDRYTPLLCDVTACARADGSAGNMSHDGQVLLYDVTTRESHSNRPSAYIENIVPVLLAACVFRALSSNGSTRHIAPSLRLFVPNSLTVYHLFVISEGSCSWRLLMVRSFPRWPLSSRYRCSHCYHQLVPSSSLLRRQ
jgi:hypothetical protein